VGDGLQVVPHLLHNNWRGGVKMNGKRKVLVLVVLAAFLSMACVCSPSSLLSLAERFRGLKATATAVLEETEEVVTPPPQETPVPEEITPTPEEGAPPPGRCFAEIPEYPGAKRDKSKEAELGQWLHRMGPGMVFPTRKGARIYITADSPSKVIEFYREQMPKKGWKKMVELTVEEGGVIVWEKGPVQAGILVGSSEGETIIIIGCGPRKKP